MHIVRDTGCRDLNKYRIFPNIYRDATGMTQLI